MNEELLKRVKEDSDVGAQPRRYFTSLMEKRSIVRDRWWNSFFKKKKNPRPPISHLGAALSSIVLGAVGALG